MENQRSTSTIDRAAGDSLIPWVSLEEHAPNAFTVAGASLLASLLVPFGLNVVIDWSWLVGIALVGFGVVVVAHGLLGLQPRTRVDSPWLATAGAVSATVAGVGGLVVLALAGLTGAAMHLPSLEFSVGQRTFVALSLTMAAGYGLGSLIFGTGLLRARSPGHGGKLLMAAGMVLLVPVVGGLLQLGFGIALPAWIVFASLGLVAVCTVAVGISLRSTPEFRSGPH